MIGDRIEVLRGPLKGKYGFIENLRNKSDMYTVSIDGQEAFLQMSGEDFTILDTAVALKDLKARPELNGEIGVLISSEPDENGRLQVLLGDGNVVKVKPLNMELVDKDDYDFVED